MCAFPPRPIMMLFWQCTVENWVMLHRHLKLGPNILDILYVNWKHGMNTVKLFESSCPQVKSVQVQVESVSLDCKSSERWLESTLLLLSLDQLGACVARLRDYEWGFLKLWAGMMFKILNCTILNFYSISMSPATFHLTSSPSLLLLPFLSWDM